MSLLKIALASIVMGAAAYWAEAGLSDVFGDASLAGRLIAVAGGIGGGVLALAATAKLLRVSEFEDVMAAMLRRVRGRDAAG